MLTGKPPFEEETPMIIVERHLYEPFPPIHDSRPDILQNVVDLIVWMTEKKPNLRPPSYYNLIQTVRGILETGSTEVTRNQHSYYPVIPSIPKKMLSYKSFVELQPKDPVESAMRLRNPRRI